MEPIVRDLEMRVTRVVEKADAQHVLACVSGGADSVALLLALLAAGADVTTLHCNFHLRGEESMRDQRLVESLCRRLGVPLEVQDFNVREWIDSHPATTGVEEACRELRYGWFRERAHALGAVIATGHNADDNVETFLLNLFRGSGLNGLKCMSEFNGEILRPLISTTREEILAYLAAKGEPFVTDSTNLQSDFRRNFLRNELIPLAETRWPALKRVITRTIENLRGEHAMLRRLRDRNADHSTVLPLADILADREGALATVFHFIAPHGGSRFTAAEAVRTAFATPYRSGARWKLDDGKGLLAERERFRITESEADENPSEIFICEEIESTPESLAEMRRPCGNSVLYLPRSLDHYILRHPVAGDRIRPLGMKGSRLLADVMRDAGISTDRRKRIWVAVEKSSDPTEPADVIWAEGVRRSRSQLVAPDAKTFYRVRRLR